MGAEIVCRVERDFVDVVGDGRCSSCVGVDGDEEVRTRCEVEEGMILKSGRSKTFCTRIFFLN